MHSLIAIIITLVPATWIVDAANGPGTNFTDLPQAVAVAASGDRIIVRPGAYTAFTVSGKALTILGAGAVVNMPGIGAANTLISGVPAGTTFYVSGLGFQPPWTPSGPHPSAGLVLWDNFGTIVLSGVSAVAYVGTGLSIGNSHVHLRHCGFTGGAGTSGTPGSGALLYGGVLVADDSIFQAGSGSIIPTAAGGGTGLSIQQSPTQSAFATLARCSATGTAGAFGGGPGVAVSGFLRAAGTSANAFTGGAGSQPASGGAAVSVSACCGSAILHGNITLVPGGSSPPTSGPVTTGPALPYLSITGTGVIGGDLSASQPVTMTLAGVLPLAPFVLAIDFAPAFSTANAPSLLGELLVPVPPSILIEGSLDALGQLQMTGAPAVGTPAFVGIPFYAQFGVLDAAAGNVRMSNGLVRRFQ